MNEVGGSQLDVPVGASSEPSLGIGGWQGLTIKDILEKVDLFNVSTLMEEDTDVVKAKKEVMEDTKPIFKNIQEKKLVVDSSNPESAFLGPKIWKNPISLPMTNDTEFSVMNIEDFLNENDFNRITPPLPDEEILGLGKEANEQQKKMIGSPMSDSGESMDTSMMDAASPGWGKPKNLLPKGENNFLYAESKRARIEREKAEKQKRQQIQIEFSQEELALATIPGADFDPKRRHFSAEELRPQPIIRKRKKTYVASEEKDDKYWERREKNNMAARRSREARRLKENQIALRTAYLEKENAALQSALDKSNDENLRLIDENRELKEKLARYERGFSPDSLV